MTWHTILLLLSPLAALIVRLMPNDLDREVLALRQHLRILRRQPSKHPRLARAEKPALLLTCLRMEKQQLLSCLLIVKPATLVVSYRQIVRQHWPLARHRSALGPFGLAHSRPGS